MIDYPKFMRPVVPEGYEWATPRDSGDFDVLSALSRRLPGEPWRPMDMDLLKLDDQGRPQGRADMPWLESGVLVLRDKAIEVVGSILAPHGEILPLRCNEARLAIFCAPTIEGALDEERSDMIRFSSGGIMLLRHPFLRRNAIGSLQAFRLDETRTSGDVYLREDLVAQIQETHLTAGTEFALAELGD